MGVLEETISNVLKSLDAAAINLSNISVAYTLSDQNSTERWASFLKKASVTSSEIERELYQARKKYIINYFGSCNKKINSELHEKYDILNGIIHHDEDNQSIILGNIKIFQYRDFNQKEFDRLLNIYKDISVQAEKIAKNIRNNLDMLNRNRSIIHDRIKQDKRLEELDNRLIELSIINKTNKNELNSNRWDGFVEILVNYHEYQITKKIELFEEIDETKFIDEIVEFFSSQLMDIVASNKEGNIKKIIDKLCKAYNLLPINFKILSRTAKKYDFSKGYINRSILLNDSNFMQDFEEDFVCTLNAIKYFIKTDQLADVENIDIHLGQQRGFYFIRLLKTIKDNDNIYKIFEGRYGRGKISLMIFKNGKRMVGRSKFQQLKQFNYGRGNG